MIPERCKRLAEVDFPFVAVSRHAEREKATGRRHPHMLHLWWARRPLAACRAMLLGLLLPDPCDPACPEEFKKSAKKVLFGKIGRASAADGERLRQALLAFLSDFASFSSSNDPLLLRTARELVKAAYPSAPPLAVDPFAGGGSIPIEALRLGCRSDAFDLNPLACLILKVILEDLPRRGKDLIREIRSAGAEVGRAAEKELSEFYPEDPDGARPVAYLWARTAVCERAGCGAEIPLVRSFWLCTSSRGPRALRYRIVERKGAAPDIEFEIIEPGSAREVPDPSISKAKARCLCCGSVLAPERLRIQMCAQRGGADVLFGWRGERLGGARLLAVATIGPGRKVRRGYRLPVDEDYAAYRKAESRLREIVSDSSPENASAIPEEPLPLMSGTFNVPIYGMNRWGDLFNARQKLALWTLQRAIRGAQSTPVCREVLALAFGKIARHSNSVSKWHRGSETVAGAFGMQALPMAWDFPEAYPFSPYAGAFEDSLACVCEALEALSPSLPLPGETGLFDARRSPLPDDSADIWFTDPPYYFSVPYADLSDFFFVWLKRMLPEHPLLKDPFDPENPLTPKARELCQMAQWDSKRYGFKDRAFFETGMQEAFAEGRRILKKDGIGCVVFAHKTTEGWESLLGGMMRAGLQVTGAWPISTERGARIRAREAAALATSVHLVCRPRPPDAPVGNWERILGEMGERVTAFSERLEQERVRGADRVFACIGPALEVYSRYGRVVSSDGREVGVDELLEQVFEIIRGIALRSVLGTSEDTEKRSVPGLMEDDARLTALFLSVLQGSRGGFHDPSGKGNSVRAAGRKSGGSERGACPKRGAGLSIPAERLRVFANDFGIELGIWEGRIIETKEDFVRLLSVSERRKQLFRDTLHRIQAPLDDRLAKQRSALTVLDAVHVGMLLQTEGEIAALRKWIGLEREWGERFLQLADALAVLYPKGREEKRLVEAILLSASAWR